MFDEQLGDVHASNLPFVASQFHKFWHIKISLESQINPTTLDCTSPMSQRFRYNETVPESREWFSQSAKSSFISLLWTIPGVLPLSKLCWASIGSALLWGQGVDLNAHHWCQCVIWGFMLIGYPMQSFRNPTGAEPQTRNDNQNIVSELHATPNIHRDSMRTNATISVPVPPNPCKWYLIQSNHIVESFKHKIE